MKILKGDKGNIDFESSLQLNEEQKERLINFLREIFYHVEVRESENFRVERLGANNAFNKEWEQEEFELLLKLDVPNKEVSRKLGRTWMSVEMKRISFIPEMMDYAMKKGVDIYKTDIKKLVREFIAEHQEKILKRKQEKREEKKRVKEEYAEIQRLKEEIPRFENLAGTPGFPNKIEVEKRKTRLKELEEKLKNPLM
jgi:hypothetical protein